MRLKYFVMPPRDVYTSGADGAYIQGFKTYTAYNYLQGGISSRIKLLHFEKALQYTKRHFHATNVIDYGCADGVFLASLSKYFNHVVGIDIYPKDIETSTRLVNALGLNNVDLICSHGAATGEIKSKIKGKRYGILYLLETLEHIGRKERLYESKMDFLKEISALIDDDGIMVVTVPRMVGLSFLVQRIGLALLGLYREPLSLKNIIKASFFSNTDELEKAWDGGHLGFNHRTMEKHLKKEFRYTRKAMLFQVVYLIKKL